MNNELPDLDLKVIGIVENEMKEPRVRPNLSEIESEIILYDRYAEAINNLDTFSDITVFYWYHLPTRQGPVPYKTYPHQNEKNPLVGVLATRGPNRPNRIAMCAARLIEIKGTSIRVAGLDAINGSPVIDIKPYNPGHDSRPEATMPEWA